MDELNAWLRGPRDWNAGVALYRNHGTDAALKVLFGLGDKPFSRQKLVAALEALAAGHARREKSRDFVTEAPDGLKLEGPEPETPPALGPVLARRRVAHNERRELFAQLRLMALDHPEKYTDAERYAVQVKMDPLNLEIDELWEAERYFKAHGKLPEVAAAPAPVPVAPPTADGLRKKLMNVRTYLTPSYRKRLKPERLAAYEAERDELERLLAETAEPTA